MHEKRKSNIGPIRNIAENKSVTKNHQTPRETYGACPPHSLIRYYVSMICCNMQLENTDVLTY